MRRREFLKKFGVGVAAVGAVAVLPNLPAMAEDVQVPREAGKRPAYSFKGDTDTGLYQPEADRWAFAVNGRRIGS